MSARKKIGILKAIRTSIYGRDEESIRPNELEAELNNCNIRGVDPTLLEELEEDNIDKSIVKEEIQQLSEEYDLHPVTLPQKLVHFLHSVPAEILIVFLIVVDIFIILAMVVLDISVERDRLKLLESKTEFILPFLCQKNMTNTNIRDFYKSIIGQHTIRKRATVNPEPDEDDFNSEKLYQLAKAIYKQEKALYILHYASLAILAFFVIELVLKIIGYGKNYFKHITEVIDGIIILISFSLDVAMSFVTFSSEASRAVLVIFLIWRIIRILNAIVLTSRARVNFRLRLFKKNKNILEEKIENLNKQLDLMRKVALQHGINHSELSQLQGSATPSNGRKNRLAKLLGGKQKKDWASCTDLREVESKPVTSETAVNPSGDDFKVKAIRKRSHSETQIFGLSSQAHATSFELNSRHHADNDEEHNLELSVNNNVNHLTEHHDHNRNETSEIELSFHVVDEDIGSMNVIGSLDLAIPKEKTLKKDLSQ